MKWRNALIGLAVAIVAMAFATVVVTAETMVTRWVQVGTKVYNAPDVAADVLFTITNTTPVSVTFVYGMEGWVVFGGNDTGEYVQTSALLKEEPAGVKAQRDAKAEEARLKNTKVGDLSIADLLQLFRQYLSGTSPVAPASTAPASPVAAVPAATKTYTVVAGDYLSLIAAKFGVDWKVLAQTNGISAPYVLNVGQVLTIPSGTVAAAPAAVSAGQPNDITSFAATKGMRIDGIVYDLPVRGDKDVRALAHVETGVAQGKNFDIEVPEGWSLGVYGVSFEIVKVGGQPVQYKGDSASIIIHGPWAGKIGAYEAGLHGLPSEWESYLSGQIFSTHKRYVPSAKLSYVQ